MFARVIRYGVLVLVFMSCRLYAANTGPFFALHEMGKGVYAAVAVPSSGAGSNAGFVVGTDSVAVIDTFEDPAAAEALLAAIHRITPLPVRYVINTHYHLDHVAGNTVFARAGAVVLAQRNVRAWERSENLKFFGEHPTPQERRRVATLGLPTVVYRDGLEIYLGGRKLVVRVLPGHTGGDSAVIVPDADVVFTGDLFWNHTLPNLIDANTAEQIASNDVFLRDYPAATFMPGHGEIGHAPEVRAFRDYLAALRQAVARAQKQGKTGGALVAAVLPELKREYGGWGWFDYFIRHNIEQTAAELNGKKRVPQPVLP